MTDREELFNYRLNQADETLNEVKRMFKDQYSPRSIINRSYYIMFYSLLALYLHDNINIKTSKHSGIISMFDREFVHKGIFDKEYSKILHIMFDMRQEYDYREFVESSYEDAEKAIKNADKFYTLIRNYITT